MPYSGQRKLAMRRQSLLNQIKRKQEELYALEGALEEVDDVMRDKSPLPDTPESRFYSDVILENVKRPSVLFNRIQRGR
jgi:hypothetical protein